MGVVFRWALLQTDCFSLRGRRRCGLVWTPPPLTEAVSATLPERGSDTPLLVSMSSLLVLGCCPVPVWPDFLVVLLMHFWYSSCFRLVHSGARVGCGSVATFVNSYVLYAPPEKIKF